MLDPRGRNGHATASWPPEPAIYYRVTLAHLAPAERRRIIEALIAQTFAVDAAGLARRTRGVAEVAFARQVAMYLAHVAWGMTLTDVGRTFRRDRTTVAHACALIEDCRDDPALDRTLDLLGWTAAAITLRAEPHPMHSTNPV